MAIEVGMILEGINEIGDYVKVGQTVKVKVLALNNGKISLSMKQAVPQERKPRNNDRGDRPERGDRNNRRQGTPRQPYKPAPPVKSPGNYEWQASKKNTPTSFEDMMSKFKQTSEDKISDLKPSAQRLTYSRRGNANGRK